MEKLDLTKRYKAYYKAAKAPETVQLEPSQYISIQGKGDPSAQRFADDVGALYAVAYTIKFICKDLGQDFTVAKLEGLWSFDLTKYAGVNMAEAPKTIPRSDWSYRLLIRMPEFVTTDQIATAKQTVIADKQINHAHGVQHFEMDEGKAVQILHEGPFDEEPRSLLLLQEYMRENNLTHHGDHHEIYLSDFRKTAPEKLKTILREPVK